MVMIRTIVVVLIFFLFHHRFGVKGCSSLSYNFYEKSCPQVEDIVKNGLQAIFVADPTSPAALLRLMFHDCQVQGCDASILVDPGEGSVATEMASNKNFGIRKRELISIVKSMVEAQCPQQVSCADLLILAAREAVDFTGGPRIKVPLRRRDSPKTPSYRLADALLPPVTAGVADMLNVFAKKGMTRTESVAILGAHTLGVTHCSNIQNRLYSHNNGDQHRAMEPGFAAFLRLTCPQGPLTSNLSFVPNDSTSFAFDNQYYVNAIARRGVLKIDAEMVLDPKTAHIMQHFSINQDDFFQAFSSAFVKLSCSGVLTGKQAVIFLFLFDITSAKVPAIFIFGDSLVDVGNNNYINTLAKATFPNGIDFCNKGSSGRFTNGRTVIDIVGKYLVPQVTWPDLGNKDFTPPYLDPRTTGDKVLKGVNYASSGSGILNDTGRVWGDHISLDEQISNFEETKKTIVSRIGRQETRRLLKYQALFVVVIGINDLLFGQQVGCFRNQSCQAAYLKNLTSTFKSQLTRLYHLEARKIVVTNIPRIGCSPFERDINPSANDCVASLNRPIHSYNRRLKLMLMDLTANLKRSIYVYADIQAILEDILHNNKSYGFKNADSACCHSAGVHGGLLPCFPLSRICPDRTKYVFWDAFHLTETSNIIAAKHMMAGDLNYVSPMNILQLVHA
ncbi:hypothetical protein PTKIN_Ptkin10aG0007300 [Pterospermum kingtungense]